MLRDAPDFQSLWGDLIVEELIRNGVDQFVVCPGSRSTPLVQAIARNPRAQATVWIDERGAAFHALGLGRGGPSAAAVVTTSGTAVANLLPAAIEASLDGIPLLLLTADRPPELREVGANQSIRQMGLFADHVRWAFDLPAPSPAMPARALLTTVGHAVARAYVRPGGPVHLNCPFREPLAPHEAPWDPAWLDDIAPWLDGDRSRRETLPGRCDADYSRKEFVARLRPAKRGLIVLGSTAPLFDPHAVHLLAERLGWPLWSDVRASPRLGWHAEYDLPHLDRLLSAEGAPQPDVILQFGGRLVSRRMQAVLDRGAADVHILVDPDPSRLDPGHVVTHRLIADIELLCLDLLEGTPEKYGVSEEWDLPREDAPDRPVSALLDLKAADTEIEAATTAAVEAGEDLSEPWVVRWLSANIQSGAGIFFSNSMVIRDAQRYAVTGGPAIHADANRGASGIDGIVSTAAGYAQGMDWNTTLVIGDLALLHDVNALAMLRTLEKPLTIVVLNNGGGSIFSFLPIAGHEDVLTPLVNTPHGVTFSGVCSSFGVPYERVTDRTAFEKAWRYAIRSGVTSVIEVASSLRDNKAQHDRIEAAIDAAVAKAMAAVIAKAPPRA